MITDYQKLIALWNIFTRLFGENINFYQLWNMVPKIINDWQSTNYVQPLELLERQYNQFSGGCSHINFLNDRKLSTFSTADFSQQKKINTKMKSNNNGIKEETWYLECKYTKDNTDKIKQKIINFRAFIHDKNSTNFDENI